LGTPNVGTESLRKVEGKIAHFPIQSVCRRVSSVYTTRTSEELDVRQPDVGEVACELNAIAVQIHLRVGRQQIDNCLVIVRAMQSSESFDVSLTDAETGLRMVKYTATRVAQYCGWLTPVVGDTQNVRAQIGLTVDPENIVGRGSFSLFVLILPCCNSRIVGWSAMEEVLAQGGSQRGKSESRRQRLQGSYETCTTEAIPTEVCWLHASGNCCDL
jgi:hypothetical protein